jgi:hypothetical protein
MRFWTSHAAPSASQDKQRFEPSPHVVSVVQDTDTALLDARTERYYTLDEVGTRIWALLVEGADVATIIDRLAEEYDAPAATIETDTHALLAALENAALVRAV